MLDFLVHLKVAVPIDISIVDIKYLFYCFLLTVGNFNLHFWTLIQDDGLITVSVPNMRLVMLPHLSVCVGLFELT